MVLRAIWLSGLGVVVSLVALASVVMPWWSIKASGVSVDVYPFMVVGRNVPAYDVDWVITSLLSLDSGLLLVGLLVVVSSVLGVVGSFRFRPLLFAPLVLNLAAAYLFFNMMYSALGDLAFGPFSGTNLAATPGEPWGFAVGIGICVLAGMASPILFGLSHMSYFRPEQRGAESRADLRITRKAKTTTAF
jgi:hypothetical protein